MRKRNVLITMAAVVGAGLLFLVANLDQPIVRNSFVYAKAAKSIIDHGFNPLPVIADPELSHGKPIGFSLLSVPLVSLLGVNAGLKVASFLGTVFFLSVACLFFVRMNRRAGIDSRFLPLELALLSLNPLVFYQFWSAYADSLFAGLVLLAFVLLDVILVERERDTRALILLLGLVIYAAILTKFYGLILGIICPAYILLNLPSFLRHARQARSKLVLLATVFLALGVAVVLARAGRNPTLDFAVDTPQGGGYAGYLEGLTDPAGGTLFASIVLFGLAIALSFHFALFFLVTGGRGAWPLAPTAFAGIYALGLLLFPGTSYNMRFFLPVFAFVAVAITSGVLRAKKATKVPVLVAYVATAGFLSLNYNLQPFYEHFLAFNEELVDPVLDRNRRLDNLRIDEHRDFSDRIQRTNGTIGPGGVLYWASTYYGTATHGLMKELGIRDDIAMHYVGTASEIPADDKAVYLAGYRSRRGLSQVAERFVVQRLGSDLFRLVPLGSSSRPRRETTSSGASPSR